MSLRNRMLLLISLLLAGAVLLTASISMWSTYQALAAYLPAERLQAVIQHEMLQASFAALVILAVGVVMSVFMSRVITRPVESFQRAAASLRDGNYQPALLSDLVTRTDELGRFGVVFDRMAREVGARDRRLNLLRIIIPIGV